MKLNDTKSFFILAKEPPDFRKLLSATLLLMTMGKAGLLTWRLPNIDVSGMFFVTINTIYRDKEGRWLVSGIRTRRRCVTALERKTLREKCSDAAELR